MGYLPNCPRVGDQRLWTEVPVIVLQIAALVEKIRGKLSEDTRTSSS
jgi:hypothetical protein